MGTADIWQAPCQLEETNAELKQRVELAGESFGGVIIQTNRRKK